MIQWFDLPEADIRTSKIPGEVLSAPSNESDKWNHHVKQEVPPAENLQTTMAPRLHPQPPRQVLGLAIYVTQPMSQSSQIFEDYQSDRTAEIMRVSLGIKRLISLKMSAIIQ